MKNLFKIHLLTYIFLLVAFLTGHFKDIVIINLIILIHESGHILMAIIFKWKIKQIVFLPFGSLTIFNELINKPLNEEFLIAIMGPIFQMIFTVLINNSLINFYSMILLIINLLPIYPLDGSKIMNIFFNKMFSFKLSHKLTIYFSYIVGIIVFIYIIINKNLMFFLFVLLLLIKLKDEFKNHNMIFNKFLYERYLFEFNFKKIKIVENERYFKRDYYHFIKKDDNLIEEKDFLKRRYFRIN